MDIKAIGTQLGDFSTLVENVNGFFDNLIPAYRDLFVLSHYWILGS